MRKLTCQTAWIQKLKKIVMKNTFLFICFMFFLNSCGPKEYRNTQIIYKGLFEETYLAFNAGVYGESSIVYITDSINFRKKIGFCDEKEGFSYDSIGDNKVKIVKYTRRSTPPFAHIDSFIIDIEELKKYKQWDN